MMAVHPKRSKVVTVFQLVDSALFFIIYFFLAYGTQGHFVVFKELFKFQIRLNMNLNFLSFQ